SLLRDEIFNIFRTEESFYLIEKRLRGKRWLVKVADPYAIPQRNIFGNFEVEFIGLKGLSESIGTTADIDSNGLRYSDELWSYGMGLLYDNESHRYTHSTRSFEIYNAGNVPIHPFQQELKILILGAGEGFELRNKTTGDVFRLTDQINGVIVINGANITDNGIQALRKTNRQFITIAPGWNEFTQNGTARISFGFRFYYL